MSKNKTKLVKTHEDLNVMINLNQNSGSVSNLIGPKSWLAVVNICISILSIY